MKRDPAIPALLAILLVAVGLRLALIVYMGGQYYFGDTQEYDQAARSILAGQGLGSDFPRPPVYPATMALGYLIAGTGNFVAVRLLQLVFGAGIVGLVYVLGRAIGGTRLGLLAAAMTAISPTLVFTTALLYPSCLYTLMLLGITLLIRRMSSAGPARAFALGLVAGLGWLTSQIIVVPLAALGGWLVFTRRIGWRSAAIAVLTAALTVAPWLAYQQAAYGRAGFYLHKADYVMNIARADTSLYGRRSTPSTVTVTDSAQVATAPPVGSAGGMLRREIGYFLANPAGYTGDYVGEFLHFFQPLPDRITSQNRFNRPEVKWLGALHFTPLLLFAIVGLLFGRAPRADRWLLAIVPLATAALYAFFFTQARYRIPVEPHMTLLAAIGLLATIDRLRGVTRAR